MPRGAVGGHAAKRSALRKISFQPTEPSRPPDARFGRAADYTWLRGLVEYSHTRKEWRLRYAPLGETDALGGRVVLIESNQVGYLVDGQFVRVQGHLVNSEGGRRGSPFYRIESFTISQ